MKVFLGGTCNGSEWRDKFIPMLNCEYFNPLVENWTREDQLREVKERETADILLYVITPEMNGVYAIAEVVDDSNKRPDKTIFVLLREGADGSVFGYDVWKSLTAVSVLVQRNGAKFSYRLEDVADYINSLEKGEETICLKN